jgi:glyceraldehyde 3-phosphate dehydrogenase
VSAPVRLGINGFGRMGRLALRAGWGRSGLQFVHVNELKGDATTCAHLLEFDSVHGRWPQRIVAADGALSVADDVISFSRSPDRPMCRGVSSASTSCSSARASSAPVVKAIHEGIGIRHGSITSLHDMTNTQSVVDAPHKDLRRARAASLSLIPTTTGSASAIGLIFPELECRLNGLAVRVPLLNASLADCVFEVARATTVAEVNDLLRAAAERPLAGILGYEERPLVSVDYKDDPRSSIVDALSTMVVGGTQVKVLAWYDNEWGYANRLVELTALVGATRRTGVPA